MASISQAISAIMTDVGLATAVTVLLIMWIAASMLYSDKSFQGMKNESESFFDVYDAIFSIIVVSVVAYLYIFQASLSVAVAVFTGVYALIAIKRVRMSETGTSPTVRRDFKRCDEEDKWKFGLRNFGPGPALYFRARAMAKPNGDEFTLEESDPPIHLSEGEFVPLLRGDLERLLDADSEEYEKGDIDRIALAYSFDSLSGRQTPPMMANPVQMSTDEFIREWESSKESEMDSQDERYPYRTQQIEKIHEYCAK